MALIDRIRELIQEGEDLAPHGGQELVGGYNGQLQPQYASWRYRALKALRDLGPDGKPLLQDLEKDKRGPYFYESSAQHILGALKAAQEFATETEVNQESSGRTNTHSRSVFVVHGQDEGVREECARFLERLSLYPVILFEKPNASRTLIEKLEDEGDVAFAVVLLTPDDVGGKADAKGEDGDAEELSPRARQNVILELGYFIGILGRSRVAAVYDESVELPSDFHGVSYIPLDAAGAWRLALAREIREAGVEVDMNQIV